MSGSASLPPADLRVTPTPEVSPASRRSQSRYPASNSSNLPRVFWSQFDITLIHHCYFYFLPILSTSVSCWLLLNVSFLILSYSFLLVYRYPIQTIIIRGHPNEAQWPPPLPTINKRSCLNRRTNSTSGVSYVSEHAIKECNAAIILSSEIQFHSIWSISTPSYVQQFISTRNHWLSQSQPRS